MDEMPESSFKIANVGWICFTVICLAFVLLGAWFVNENQREVSTVLRVVLYLLAGGLSTIAFGAVAFVIHFLIQRARKLRAEADLAGFYTAGPQDQVFRAVGRNEVEALHIDPRWRHDGVYTEPTQTELYSFTARLASLASGGKQVLAGPEPEIEIAAAPSILAELARFDRALIHGGSGGGKTNLTQHQIASSNAQVVVLDPHDNHATWPESTHVVGGGEDWDAIEGELAGWVAEKHARYARREQEHIVDASVFPALFMVADEWLDITQHCETAGDSLAELLTAIRKVNMRLWILSQSDRAGSLGLARRYDLIDCFEAIVRMRGNKATGWSASIQTVDGEYEVQPPGAFAGAAQPKICGYTPGQVAKPVNHTDQRVLEMHAAGNSITRIGKEVFGGGRSEGGQQNDLVREILKKHNRM